VIEEAREHVVIVYFRSLMNVFVIIPAAGLGTRMAAGAKAASKAKKAKQFTEINGAPIVVHTLRRFGEAPEVTEIVIALRKSEMAGFQKIIAGEPFASKTRLVEGGENRQESVGNALASIKGAKDDIVLVHDAVRPFIDRELISNTIAAAKKNGAVIVGLPAVDTIKQVDRTADGAIITSTIPRERVVMAQTPQGFTYAVIKKAFDDAKAEGFTGTDEASLVERMGHSVHVVMGSARNIKITTPADMELAEFYSQKK
jgi:2-C-methyl-D-erythritol 4-phosphate cytidylyltransferase